MKKEFIKYSLLVLVCFSMMACNDWLSVKPKTEMEAEDLFSTEAGNDKIFLVWPGNDIWNC